MSCFYIFRSGVPNFDKFFGPKIETTTTKQTRLGLISGMGICENMWWAADLSTLEDTYIDFFQFVTWTYKNQFKSSSSCKLFGCFQSSNEIKEKIYRMLKMYFANKSLKRREL